MSSPATPDFAEIAARYDELRSFPQEVADRLLGEIGQARRVLDVGCGTGTLAIEATRRGSRVWGVDPTPEMLEVARRKVPPGVGLRAGRAEALPFKDGWFDAVLYSLVVHLVERPAALAEAFRVLVPGGRIGIATFDPERFAEWWLGRLFPSIAAIDRERFPGEQALVDELAAAGFERPRVARLTQSLALGRDRALERIRGRHISTFQLIGDDEYRRGLAIAEQTLPDEIDAAQHWLIMVAER